MMCLTNLRWRGVLCAMATLWPATAALGGEKPSCEPEWVPTYGGHAGVNGIVRALQVFDDGSGEAIFVGGGFTMAGTIPTGSFARWNGDSWSSVGADFDDVVSAMAVFVDGSGPALYVGGAFTTAGGQPAPGIAKWDGKAWSSVGGGVAGGLLGGVFSMFVFDDDTGSGPALFVGGRFTSAGGVAATNIAKWDGASWSSVGDGLGSSVSDAVLAIEVFDDGSGAGPALYAGGNFSYGLGDGTSINRIAKLDGDTWLPVGDGTDNTVLDLVVFNDGSGEMLYAGGDFEHAGSVDAPHVARWNGSEWLAVGAGLEESSPSDYVRNLYIATIDGAARLYAGGRFTNSGGSPVDHVACWNGKEWLPVGDPDSYTYAFAMFDDGSGNGPELHIGTAQLGLQKLTDGDWRVLGGGISDRVYALHAFDDGTGFGTTLYAGGWFVAANGNVVRHVARWAGNGWEPVGSGLDGQVLALTTLSANDQPFLLAGGRVGVTTAGYEEAAVHAWDGEKWSPFTSALRTTESPLIPAILSLIVFDDGSGTALYAGGHFTHAGDTPLNHIARWTGESWEPLGQGSDERCNAFCVFDDGSGEGPRLYATGHFHSAVVKSISKVGRWNGTAWEPIGSMDEHEHMNAIAVFDDGSGPALFAAGNSLFEGDDIVKLVNGDWMTIGTITDGSTASSLAVYDDGSGAGPALYVGGSFEEIDGVRTALVAKWDGSTWMPVGAEFDQSSSSRLFTMVTFDDGSGPALIIGGDFVQAPSGDSYVAKWQGCATACLGDLVAGSTFASGSDGVVDGADLAFLISEWGVNPGSPADMVRSATFQPPPDGLVDAADLAVLLGAWGVCE